MRLITLCIWLSGFCISLFEYSKADEALKRFTYFVFLQLSICFIGDEPSWITFCNFQFFFYIPKKYFNLTSVPAGENKDESEHRDSEDI